ncbi:MAG: hypothetical protein EOP83_30680 [Verrucomicrobiaceae bacterium]|nr:MAG: hypothetical protein EOP83_30680 [Verrucomicrobiaceae bacterium]
MSPTTFILAPVAGWDSFPRSRELERYFDDFFDRERSEEPWCYYGFTSNTAIWDSDDTENKNYVFVTYASDRVSEVAFVMTECSGIHYREIKDLKERLKAEFGLEEAREKES